MNPNPIHVFASRRRKLDIEEVYDVYSAPPNAKMKKAVRPDEQVVGSGMDVDVLPTPCHARQFPVNSFPLDGVNKWMCGQALSTVHTIQSLPPVSKRGAHERVWSQGTVNLPAGFRVMDSGVNRVSCVNPIGHDGLGVFQGENRTMTQHTLTTHQGGNCPQCLSGEPGHFHHIQSRLQQLKSQAGTHDGMACHIPADTHDGLTYQEQQVPMVE